MNVNDQLIMIIESDRTVIHRMLIILQLYCIKPPTLTLNSNEFSFLLDSRFEMLIEKTNGRVQLAHSHLPT
jgi:hypothetical protein